MNARPSTKANTSGACDVMTSMKSFEPAVAPVTATSAPANRPTVAGTTSERRASSERSEAASVPLPLTESATTATVLSGLMSTVEGSESSPVARAWSWSWRMAAWTGGAGAAGGLVVEWGVGGLGGGGGDVGGFDPGRGGEGPAGEGVLDAVVGLDDGLA